MGSPTLFWSERPRDINRHPGHYEVAEKVTRGFHDEASNWINLLFWGDNKSVREPVGGRMAVVAPSNRRHQACLLRPAVRGGEELQLPACRHEKNGLSGHLGKKW